MKQRNSFFFLTLLLFCLVALGNAAEFLQIKDGYFWTPSGGYFLPHGMAYQTLNPQVFASQSLEQIEYDIRMMKRMNVNSLRVEFNWPIVNRDGDRIYNFTVPDFLINLCEELDMKMFVLLGYQYPPWWLTYTKPEVMAIHWDPISQSYGQSAILNYLHPVAQQAYTTYLTDVVTRYKDRTSIAGWIVGNEFAFYDLWEETPRRRFVGFDTQYSLPSYRNYLQSVYGTIAALNVAWGTSYADFNSVPMAKEYPPDRTNQLEIQQSGYHDLLQWRKMVVGDFLALGAKAARIADPNHLLTYAMVGSIFNGFDQNIASEDAPTIVARCKLLGYPLDFWTINNYPWTLTGSEMRSADFGVSKYTEMIDIPVLVTETGITSNDNLFVEAAQRYAQALPGFIWEHLMAGAIGVHVFHWSDRDGFLSQYFPREAGFGVVKQDRTTKSCVRENVANAFRRMEEIDLGLLLSSSNTPAKDIWLLWGKDVDISYNRVNQEVAMIWAAFKRLGFQVGILSDEEFDAGLYMNSKAVFLPRNYQMKQSRLDALETQVINRGIHLHASTDFPGQYNEHHSPNPNWISKMASIFGLDVTLAVPGWDSGVAPLGEFHDDYRAINNYVQRSIGSLVQGPTPISHGTWKIWHGVTAIDGESITLHTGNSETQSPIPGLHIKDHGVGKGKSAINTFALGDIMLFWGDPRPLDYLWSVRYDYLEVIYKIFFGMTPDISLSNGDYKSVIIDKRIITNPVTLKVSYLISLNNLANKQVSFTVTSSIFIGKKIENLIKGEIIAAPSTTGSFVITLNPDEFNLLYVYDIDGSLDNSLITTSPHKLYFDQVPEQIWPNLVGYTVTIKHHVFSQLDLSLTLESYSNGIYKTRAIATVDSMSTIQSLTTGLGSTTFCIIIKSFDINDPTYISTDEGGNYFFTASLKDPTTNTIVSTIRFPVHFSWPLKPKTALPITSLNPSTSYNFNFHLEELPSFHDKATILNRQYVWPSSNDPSESFLLRILLIDPTTKTILQQTDYNSNLIWTGSQDISINFVTPSTINAVSSYDWQVMLLTSDFFLPVGLYNTGIVVTNGTGALLSDQFMILSDSNPSFAHATIQTWGPSVKFETLLDPTAIEGSYINRLTSSSYAGFMITTDDNSTVDLSRFSNQYSSIKFYARTSLSFIVSITDGLGLRVDFPIASTNNLWKEITIPLTSDCFVHYKMIQGLFIITLQAAGTLDIDSVSWNYEAPCIWIENLPTPTPTPIPTIIPSSSSIIPNPSSPTQPSSIIVPSSGGSDGSGGSSSSITKTPNPSTMKPSRNPSRSKSITNASSSNIPSKISNNPTSNPPRSSQHPSESSSSTSSSTTSNHQTRSPSRPRRSSRVHRSRNPPKHREDSDFDGLPLPHRTRKPGGRNEDSESSAFVSLPSFYTMLICCFFTLFFFKRF